MYTKAYFYNRHHLVFTTKYRAPLITDEVMRSLNRYFKKKAGELGFKIYIVNGYKDHVHLLISSPPRLSISYIVKRLKGYSSYCICDLWWSRGYAAFSIDAGSFVRIYKYIKNQKHHHGGGRFKPAAAIGEK